MIASCMECGHYFHYGCYTPKIPLNLEIEECFLCFRSTSEETAVRFLFKAGVDNEKFVNGMGTLAAAVSRGWPICIYVHRF